MTLIVREEYPLLWMIERELECNEFLLLSPEYLDSGMSNQKVVCPISLGLLFFLLEIFGIFCKSFLFTCYFS